MDLVGQRMFGIACGHPDCNDGDRLADDPVHKLLLDRDPDAGRPKPPLVSWKSLCRRAINGSIRPALQENHRSGQRRLDDDGDHDDRKRIVRTAAVE